MAFTIELHTISFFFLSSTILLLSSLCTFLDDHGPRPRYPATDIYTKNSSSMGFENLTLDSKLKPLTTTPLPLLLFFRWFFFPWKCTTPLPLAK
jgi:hypothetical protein